MDPGRGHGIRGREHAGAQVNGRLRRYKLADASLRRTHQVRPSTPHSKEAASLRGRRLTLVSPWPSGHFFFVMLDIRCLTSSSD